TNHFKSQISNSKSQTNPKSEIQNLKSPPPSHYWTWRLLAAGFSMAECMAVRNLSREAVLDHAIRAAEDGLAVEAQWCLAPDRLAALGSLIGETRPTQIRPLLAQLPPGTLYGEVQLYLKCRAASKGP
ncbi:MAG: helix-turn-helix domain-containing protein, partial [Thermoguttaceae bacterium]